MLAISSDRLRDEENRRKNETVTTKLTYHVRDGLWFADGLANELLDNPRQENSDFLVVVVIVALSQ